MPFAVAFLAHLAGRPALVVTASAHAQASLLPDLQALRPDVLDFPAWETLPHEDILPDEQTVADRLRVLAALVDHPSSFVVAAPVQALLQRTFSPAAFAREQFTLTVGRSYERSVLVDQLTRLGYHPQVQVGEPGDFAVRGGIVDFYPLNTAVPVRVEFLGDQLESIRTFDPTSQQTQSLLPRVDFAAAGELGFLKQHPEQSGSLADFLPPETLLVLVEPDAVDLAAAAYQQRVPDADPFHVPWSQWLSRDQATVHLTEQPALAEDETHWDWGLTSLEAFRALDVPASTPEVAEQSRRAFFDQLTQWLADGWSVHVFGDTDAERRRITDLWQEHTSLLHPSPAPLDPHPVPLSRGFLWPAVKLAVITAAEIFGRYRQRQPRRQGYATAPVADWKEFDEGDYVVHLQHGVARYLGFRVIETAGHRQEVLAVEYADEARLYVPLDQAHLLSKYVGLGKRIPELHELGGTKWDRQKLGAERAIMDLAADLLGIQAARATLAGHACAPDTPWQRDFESTFPYEETPDQLTTIDDVKRDLEIARPMDRLVCGDVGFGKTEIAIRAAFKAVMEGLQVAVLCPTTVLAEQHWNTFRERMAGFPVVVEMLSRFRTPRDQKRVAKVLRAGGVDIVIGTHRLLSADV
ncbi:DEAD/DEAH box helicase, partial [bacterium]|nr:DEAD/DEAH box helicase [bacterium]